MNSEGSSTFRKFVEFFLSAYFFDHRCLGANSLWCMCESYHVSQAFILIIP